MIESMLNNGVDLILLLQSLGDWIYAPMKLFTLLGSEEFYLLVMPILYWAVSASLGFRVGVMLLFACGSNVILKWALHLPRPYWYDARVQGLVAETLFGAPSLHSQVPASIFGLIAATFRRGWIWASVIPLIFVIGTSRLVLGVHFYIDVLLGWALGAVGIWIFISSESRVKAWFDGQRVAAQVGAVFLSSIGMIAIGVLVLAQTGDFQLPETWIFNALLDHPEIETLDPFELEALISPSGALFGLGAGRIWLSSRGGFDAGGRFWKRFLRVVVGLAGVIILWHGLGSIFPRDPDLLGYSLRYLRYASIGLWSAAIAPLIFIRLNLAERDRAEDRI
jgi:membrane-associated phospholipid phosphatase